jgi:hypothetical protein
VTLSCRLAAIQEHLSHPTWPSQRQISMDEEPALLCLAEWARLMGEYIQALVEAGGSCEPIPALYKDDVFSAVLAVCSSNREGSELMLDQALPTLARLVAQDTRVYVDVMKIEGTLQVVQCFQFKTRVLFTVYDPTTSRWSYCFTEIDRIGKLLEPNFTEEEGFVVKYPPRDLQQLYKQLLQLMRFQM